MTWQVPVTRLRTVPGPPDRYGEPGPGGVVETELPAALFAPAATSEPVAAGAAPVLSAPLPKIGRASCRERV